MKSNYEPIGKHIKLVDARNTNLKVKKLLGLSISKEFIPSVANIIGTDMENYKIIRQGQFACSLMQVRRDKKMPVALMQESEAIMSPAYPIFEVKDTEILLPEYLMMWFKRPEFDREACFYAVGGVRGSLEWDDFCAMSLPIPSIAKQREIVQEYQTIENRIKLNEQITQRLEETAQALYKQWFIDFEFPDEAGKPYKANGGEMIDSELGEIPKGWNVEKLGKLCDCNYDNLTPKDKFQTIEYLDTSSIVNNEIFEMQTLNTKTDNIPSRAKRKVSHNDVIFSTVRPNLKHFGIIKYPPTNMIVSTGFAVLKPTYEGLCSELFYLWITNDKILQNLQARAEMSVSTYPSIVADDLLNLDIVLPSKSTLEKIAKIYKPIFELIHQKNIESKDIALLKDVFLSKLATVAE
ncbi:MAG: restriction endonuclease subunit S [Bacteroidetes bacterium]|nr:MAG: restriction endonuclease subunit S [Bacteroidota bacterium]